MLVKILREGLGRIFVFFDWITRPKPLKRDSQAQSQVEGQLQSLSLYQFYACPFCIKVRRHMHKLALPLTLKDAQKDQQARRELEQGGGRIKVPCLRIKDANGERWLYESSDINQYLTERFGQ